MTQSDNHSKILVVDDNDANMLVATATLDYLGHQYDIAKDGVAAVELFSTNKYAAVLMDMQMPEMTGYEAIQQIRAYELRNDLPRTRIIVITANTSFQDNQSHLRNSMDGFIIKPYQPEELSRLLQLPA